MTDYCSIELSDYELKAEGEGFSDEGVSAFCFSALHTALPYLAAFSKDAWFTWEKDKDAVSVLCPMGLMAMKIRKAEDGKARVAVEESNGCPRHSLGDVFELPLSDERYPVLDSLYPLTSHLTESGAKVRFRVASGQEYEAASVSAKAKETADVCELEEDLSKEALAVDVVGMRRSCAYHRRKASFPVERLIPEGFCHFSYHSMYPLILPLLYNCDGPDTIEHVCPGQGNSVVFSLKRTPKRYRAVRGFLEKALRLIGFPQDIILDDVNVTVKEVRGACPAKLRNGDSFVFGEKGLLCPAAFDGVFVSLISGKGSVRCPATPCRIECEVKKG